eukprot:TRINITY_DN215_c0_g2_i3.p1 TRINITY_DN215_c0_g2~~TRINITY_DN215_c0_g2_i3.p1  ORF type:complete len:253 (+),score=29.25 TRINITY_DN215_c0_g2_i3:54-812(+)
MERASGDPTTEALRGSEAAQQLDRAHGLTPQTQLQSSSSSSSPSPSPSPSESQSQSLSSSFAFSSSQSPAPAHSAAQSSPTNVCDPSKSDGFFDCNICLDTASDPVVTFCGHLFCWPCIYKWVELHSDSPICPVCKAELSTAKMIPVYGRGRGVEPKNRDEPSANVPHRPTGQRTEPERRPSQSGISGQPQVHFHNVSIFGGLGGYPSLFSRQFVSSCNICRPSSVVVVFHPYLSPLQSLKRSFFRQHTCTS